MKQKPKKLTKTSSREIEENKYWIGKVKVERTDIKHTGHNRGYSFLQMLKQYEGYLPDDKF